ncbi:MAG: LysM peptidoglycan-binding domain-containing protein [Bauldia sp.]
MKREGWLASLFALGTIATLVGVFVYLIVRDPLPTPINKSTREIAAAEVRPTPPPPPSPLPSPPAPSLLFEPAPAIAAARDPLPLPPPPAPKLPAPQDPPSFDLIRVEPNGAAVLAGQAEPGAKVEIMDAGKAIATGKANLRGEWVLSLDRPLTTGAHDLALRTTAVDQGTQTVSDQRIAVHVPPKGSTDVLVVATAPNRPSRIFELPPSPPAAPPGSNLAGPTGGAAPPPRAASQPAPTGRATPGEPPAPTTVADTAPAPADRSSGRNRRLGESVPVATGGEQLAAVGPGGPAEPAAPAPGAVDLVRGGVAAAAAPPAASPRAGADAVALAATPAAEARRPAVEGVIAATDPAPAQSPGAAAAARTRAFVGPEQTGAIAAAPSPAGAREAPTLTAPPPRPGTAGPPPAQLALAQPAGVRDAAVALAAPALTVEAVEVDTDGKLYVAGAAAAIDTVRLYVDDAFVGEVQPLGGRWLLDTKRDLKPGRYAIRADQVSGPNGTVIARAEVPFEREADAPALRPVGPNGPTEPQTVIIRRGDNLWGISRRVYGDGLRYSVIYQANVDQIRNPNKIYPGQVFVVPQSDAKKN